MMHAFLKLQPLYSDMDNLPHNDRIELAIADLESQDRPNYAATAKKWQIDRSTLSRRHRGVTGTKEDQYSYSVKALTDIQESVLVQCINDLSARGLPPTPQIVKNLAEELANKELSHNWVGRFIERKKKVLKSIYLTTMDHKRKIADNSRYYEHFFENVSLFFSCVLSLLRILFITKPLLYLAAREN